MLNLKTLLSTFNEKGTLLKWLQKLEAALSTSTLTDVTIFDTAQVGETFTFKMRFVFADDTHIDSSTITVPLLRGLQGIPGATGPEGPAGPQGIDGEPGPEGTGILNIKINTEQVPEAKFTRVMLQIDLTSGDRYDFEFIVPYGEQGVGITKVENNGYSYGDDFTVSHVDVALSDGTTEHLDIQAVNGANYSEYIITAPSGAVSGTLPADVVAGLQANKGKVIVLDNEIYRYADNMSAEGYLVYSHLGQDNAQEAYAKFITITLSTNGWVKTAKKIGAGLQLFMHNLTIKPDNSDVGEYQCTIINDNPTKINLQGLISYIQSLPNKTNITFLLSGATLLGSSLYIGCYLSGDGGNARLYTLDVANKGHKIFNILTIEDYVVQLG